MKKGHCTLAPDKPFNKCCARHDIDYERKLKTRLQADRDFLNCMLGIAGNSIRYKAMAYTYYYAVRMFGWRFWK